MGASARRFRMAPCLLMIFSACATARVQTEVAPPLDPREIGRPPETLDEEAASRLDEALEARGLREEPGLPGDVRASLLRLQLENGLAPTGWLDRDTAELLGLSPDEVLPLAVGAGSYRSSGATFDGGQVGGERGPASLPPDARELGAVLPLRTGTPRFHYDESRRLRAAAAELRARSGGQHGERTLRQADKAQQLAVLHDERLGELGGEAALVGAGGFAPDEQSALPPPNAERPVPSEADGVQLAPAELRRMQRSLFAEGFLHQPPSGELDDPTRQALRAWQSAQGFEPTGALDRRSADRLLASPAGERSQGERPPGSDSTGAPEEGFEGGGEADPGAGEVDGQAPAAPRDGDHSSGEDAGADP